ncbi:MAG: UDP-2,4-diacetamido-2,4,6-trideoxy-beta-L-altropyranose hydrolase [Desulfobacula sp.]|nr:UDP-2,4-diacetamido-2,4,6-trideoxy-beta-L-altropyranose hydrolase [Desulfobacula sp.]
MNTHRLYIRADAGSIMGTGHIMRCIALAQAWQQWGGSVCFITHGPGPFLISMIKEQGFEHRHIPEPSPDPKDIRQTLQFIEKHGLNRKIKKTAPPAWVVLDGYHFSMEYQKAIQGPGYRLLVLDDYNHLPSYCADILLNQNQAALSYVYQCPGTIQKLLGTDYTLLRNEFLSKKQENRTVPLKATRILVTMGGVDPGNITPLIIRAIQDLNDPDLETRVVVGPSNPHYNTLTSVTSKNKTCISLIKDPAMPELMEWADLAVTAGGSTCWEMCFMGLPFIVIPVAPNQVDIAACLERDLGAVNAGPIDMLTTKKITDLLRNLILSPHKRKVISVLGQDLIDGSGAKRVLRQMCLGNIQMKLKKPVKDETKSNTYRFNTGHKSRVKIGQVILTDDSNVISIGYIIKTPFQGLGLAPVLLENVIKRQGSKNKIDHFSTRTFLLNPKPLACQDKLTITLVSDKNSWINPYLFHLFVQILLRGHKVKWINQVPSITASDIVFYLGCGQLAPSNILKLNKHNIIVHGSDLPRGKGWSPISWQILEGQNTIPLTLFEAAPKVDSGMIYLQKKIIFKGHELIDEIRKKTAGYTIDICLDFLENHQFLALSAKKQQGQESFYPKRTPKDSRLDPDKTLREQFNLLRIGDNQNYPVFFTLNQVTYKLAISKMETYQDEN